LETLQKKRIREILEYAYDNVPFYKQKFDKEGIRPSDFKNLKDIEKFPTTTVDELKKAIKENQVGKFNSKCNTLSTTGSTGTPFVFQVNQNAENERVGCTLRTREWYGHDFGVKNIRLWRTENNESVSSRLKRVVLSRLDLSIYNADEIPLTNINQ
jgi:phenylacetate-CoA ligase